MTQTYSFEELTTILGREPTEVEEKLLADFTQTGSLGNKLFTRIGRVNIDHPVIARAFESFIQASGQETDNFRLVDLLSLNESIRKNGFVYGNVGDYILIMSRMPTDKKLAAKVFKNSVNGIYELIDRTNGICLDLSSLPDDNIQTLSGKRFVFADKKLTSLLLVSSQISNCDIKVVGIITSEKKVRVIRNGITEADLEKSFITPDDRGERVEVDIPESLFMTYKSSFFTVLGYRYCLSAMQNATFNIGSDCSFPELLTILLAAYAASKSFGLLTIKIVFGNNEGVNLNAACPEINVGDRIYLIKPYVNNDGVPMQSSYKSVNSYITSFKANTGSAAVYPVNATVGVTLSQLFAGKYTLSSSIDFVYNEQAPCSLLLITNVPSQGKYLGTVAYPQPKVEVPEEQ